MLQAQKALQESLKQEFIGLPLGDTLYQVILQGDQTKADRLKKDFKVPDKRFWWIKVRMGPPRPHSSRLTLVLHSLSLSLSASLCLTHMLPLADQCKQAHVLLGMCRHHSLPPHFLRTLSAFPCHSSPHSPLWRYPSYCVAQVFFSILHDSQQTTHTMQ